MKKLQSGMTLIEILVAVLVLAIGVLGSVAMQTRALAYNQSSFNRAQASMAANDILDRMRANNGEARAGSYNLSLDASASGSSVAQVDLSEWLTSLSTLLPSGDGSIAVASNVATVTIQWNEARAEQSANSVLQQFIYTSEL